jgi:hypothetical protein
LSLRNPASRAIFPTLPQFIIEDPANILLRLTKKVCYMVFILAKIIIDPCRAVDPPLVVSEEDIKMRTESASPSIEGNA